MPIGTAQPTTQASAPRKVTVTMTAAEINQYLSGESFSQEGASVKDLRVTITPQQMRIDGYVSQPSYGFAGDMTIYGRPQVVGAQLYFRVDSVKLGSQFSGFVRSIAENMILSKIQEKNGPNGIPIEAELLKDMTVTSVALGDGELLVEGLQR